MREEGRLSRKSQDDNCCVRATDVTRAGLQLKTDIVRIAENSSRDALKICILREL